MMTLPYDGTGSGQDYDGLVAKLDLSKSGASSLVFLTYYGTGNSSGNGTQIYGR